MALDLASFGRSVLERTAVELRTWIETTVPQLVRVLLFLCVAFVGIRLVRALLRRVLRRVYDERQTLVADLIGAVVSVFLWFGVALASLSMLGLSGIAASLGTATGFVALGIAYALSEMIEDTVAGVYLLRDPDFELGDHVETEKADGVVRAIALRKCRLEQDDGDVVVVANRDVESRWTRRGEGT